MNYFKLFVLGVVGGIFFFGDIHVSEAKGRSRKFAAEPASAEGPSFALPIFSYGPDGTVFLSENGQQFVEVDYTYDKNGNLGGAAGKGSFKIGDGLGNLSKGTIKQDYKIISGKARLTKDRVAMDISAVDGSHSKQNIVTTVSYDKAGRLMKVIGMGDMQSNDGFGNISKSTIQQTFVIVGGRAKFKNSKIDSKTKNMDGEGKNQNLTITYQYDAKGEVKKCSGAGTFKKDDGFGNVTMGTISQTYKIVNGQARLVASTENPPFAGTSTASRKGEPVKGGEITPAGGKSRKWAAEPASVLISPTLLPPPSKEQQKQAERKGTLTPQPIQKGIRVAPTPPPQEEAVWRRPPAEYEPEVPSVGGQPCEANVPQYQQRGCVEAAQPQEEVRQPQVCERGEWSTTLRMCVE